MCASACRSRCQSASINRLMPYKPATGDAICMHESQADQNTDLRLMSRYNRFKEQFFLARLRTLRGKVLELGFGDADTLFHYDPGTEVVAVEKNGKWVDRARYKLEEQGIRNVHVELGSAEKLPFLDGEFDFVTSSFMLCSVDSQPGAIAEMYRVLKPGGRYVALEHTLSKNSLFRGLQKVLARPISKIADNCHLNSDPLAVIGLQPFRILKTEYFPYYLEPPLFIEAEKSTSYEGGSIVTSKEEGTTWRTMLSGCPESGEMQQLHGR